MKQKKGDVSIKSQLNGVKKQKNGDVKTPVKGTPAKTAVKGTPAKTPLKKTGKTPVKVVPPKKVEEEEDEESDEEEDSGADVAGEIANAAEEDSDVEEQDDSEDEDDDEDDDDVGISGLINNEAVEDDDDDDDEDDDDDDEDEDVPVEAPIEKKSAELPPKAAKNKKSKTADETGVPKIKTGALPSTFPKDQVLVVKNLPKEYKQIDLVEVFAKFGTLNTIYNNHGPVSSIAFVAYNSAEEAEAAQIATDNIAKVKGATLRVNIQSPNVKRVKKQELIAEKKRKYKEAVLRRVHIKNMKIGTTIDHVKAHFADCGEIENVEVFSRTFHWNGFVCFKDESSVPAALNLHNSILNGTNIWVVRSSETSNDIKKNPECTVVLKNTGKLSHIESSKIESIFSKCGEIEGYTLLCSKTVLAFITFKDPKGVKKALKLNGTNSEGVVLDVDEYKFGRGKTTVFVQNVRNGVKEEDVRELFSSAGPIENVNVVGNHAIVRFQDSDGFCKAFLLNETHLRGQPIFLEPYSERKLIIMRKSNQQRPGFNRKRPGQFNQGGFAKKMKAN